MSGQSKIDEPQQFLYRVAVSARTPDKYIAITDMFGENAVRGEEVDAYIIYCTDDQMEKLSKLSWVKDFGLYDVFLRI